MTLPTGTKIGRYEIRSKIGEGGMGEVYLAQDTKLDCKVALKISPADLASQRDRMERFIREAKSAAALSHEHRANLRDRRRQQYPLSCDGVYRWLCATIRDSRI